MNMHTFKDAVASRRQTVADQFIDDDDDEQNEKKIDPKRQIEGEEEEDGELGAGKFNDTGDAITPFNMKEERESGFIDEDMNFVFKKEQQEVDAWVATLTTTNTETSINNAALAEKRRLARIADQERNQSDLDRKSPMELKLALLALMQPNETVQRTLRRLSGKEGNHREDAGAAVKRRRPNAATAEDNSVTTKPVLSAAEQQRQTARLNRESIERITELADRLIAQGMSDIYATSYEALQATTTRWEYQGADGKIYGPFTTQQIVQWRQQGFLTGDTAVLIRTVTHRSRQPPSSSTSSQQKPQSIYDDEDDNDDNEKSRKKARTEDNTASSAIHAPAIEAAWQHSDSIDYHALLRLDAQANDAYDQAGDNEDETNNARRTANQSNQSQQGKKTLRFAADTKSQDTAAAAEEDDDDEDEDNVEGFRRRRQKPRHREMSQEDEDEDEEDDD